ncbi:hypothetical protein M413DRAFT_347443 [Hebeloma cylindrosporum]|uniref:Uncharacterized protein n=1 Tax=Hebeloma cylindrosporum TaxID=76867 RepID=A0A0C2XC73_HEBCY|nr:hypothetical protein M413DRAFT_347443 [Hebeloma cylindrosporum h7]
MSESDVSASNSCSHRTSPYANEEDLVGSDIHSIWKVYITTKWLKMRRNLRPYNSLGLRVVFDA